MTIKCRLICAADSLYDAINDTAGSMFDDPFGCALLTLLIGASLVASICVGVSCHSVWLGVVTAIACVVGVIVAIGLVILLCAGVGSLIGLAETGWTSLGSYLSRRAAQCRTQPSDTLS